MSETRGPALSVACSQVADTGDAWEPRPAGLHSQLTPALPWEAESPGPDRFTSPASLATAGLSVLESQTLGTAAGSAPRGSTTDRLKLALALLARLGVAKEHRASLIKAVQQRCKDWRSWSEDRLLEEVQAEARRAR